MVHSCGGQVAVVIEKYPDKAASFSRRFGATRQYTTVEDLIRDGGVDALIICAPNFFHAPQAEVALKAGLPVLVEKPMAINAVEAAHILETSQESGAALMVAHGCRFDEDVNWLKNQIPRIGGILRTKGYGVHTNREPGG